MRLVNLTTSHEEHSEGYALPTACLHPWHVSKNIG
jgi:hypothetical protein